MTSDDFDKLDELHMSEHTLRLDRDTVKNLIESGTAKMTPTLLVIQGFDRGESVVIHKTPMLLGRGENCDYQMRDDGISRTHAQVIRDDMGRYVIEDLNSTNGIFVNRKRVARHVFEEGDKVLVGRRTVLKFVFTDAIDRQYQKQMYDSAVKDGLTGVFNRKHFEKRFTSEMSYAVRHSSPLSILIFDLDHFKHVNDTYGHQLGDQVLVKVAQAIHKTLREEDFLARYGGEEFVILARGIGQEGAAAMGERIRIVVQDLRILTPEGIRVPITVSIGVATYFKGAQQANTTALLRQADDNLYAAKEDGRNRVVST